jgi:hypothetical protein
LVFGNEYFNYYCEKCGELYGNDYDYDYDKWCKSCNINHLKGNFTNWTSGDEKIDNFIQNKQLNIKASGDLIFEWIPYNELTEIKEMGKGGFSVAIWKKGPLNYGTTIKALFRKSYKKVVLKHLYNLQNLTDEFLNEV